LAIDREWPVSHKIKFGFGGAVAIGGDIMTDILDAIGKELALLQLKSNTVFHKNVTHTFKQAKQRGKQGSP